VPRELRERDPRSKSARRREDLLDRLVDIIVVEGFAHASVEDLARSLSCSKTTLYSIAETKERIIAAAVRRFFRRATLRVDAQLIGQVDPIALLRGYLTAIALELSPATPAFFADIDSLTSTQEIYRQNTLFAARRVQTLVREASPGAPTAQAIFVGAVAAQVMEGIHRGEIESATGLDDSDAYHALADLIVRGLEQPTAR
jgi:AcrR family transcriptional regulator